MPMTLDELADLEDLCLDEFDAPESGSLLRIWNEWRDAVRAHVSRIQEQGAEYHASQARFPENIRHLGLPTFFAAGMAQRLWEDAAAKHRAAGGVPAHGYVAKTGGAYEAVCSEHPRFRRVAWTQQGTPLSSAREHNREHHGGAPARVYDVPGREPSTLLP